MIKYRYVSIRISYATLTAKMSEYYSDIVHNVSPSIRLRFLTEYAALVYTVCDVQRSETNERKPNKCAFTPIIIAVIRVSMLKVKHYNDIFLSICLYVDTFLLTHWNPHFSRYCLDTLDIESMGPNKDRYCILVRPDQGKWLSWTLGRYNKGRYCK